MTGKTTAVLADFNLKGNRAICSAVSPVVTLSHYSAETESERAGGWKMEMCDQRGEGNRENIRVGS